MKPRYGLIYDRYLPHYFKKIGIVLLNIFLLLIFDRYIFSTIKSNIAYQSVNINKFYDTMTSHDIKKHKKMKIKFFNNYIYLRKFLKMAS